MSTVKERLNAFLRQVEGRLIVSCQASPGDAFYGEGLMARFAQAAVMGGASGIRAHSAEDIRSIREAVDVPVIGIFKQLWEDGRILITPTFESARSLADAGSAMIALDCTARGQRYGALDRLKQIREQLQVPVMADIATLEEAIAAEQAGADVVASTMRGYTDETAFVDRFQPEFITALRKAVPVPVLAEGRIATPREAQSALEAGAAAVIVGSAITRPHLVTEDFVRAVRAAKRTRAAQTVVGIDLGGTNTKYGLVSSQGELLWHGVVATPAHAGRDGLLAHLRRVAQTAVAEARAKTLEPAAVGVATAGWVNSETGVVAYATENLPGWTGTRIAEEVSAAVQLPVGVENDANALAVAEKHYGAARGAQHFVCLTLGTGVGGGCYVRGELLRGKHYFANALGHITVEAGGEPCSCGRRGCLEMYANSAALLRFAGGPFSTAEEVIQSAKGGDAAARQAVEKLAHYLALGTASIIHVLDPEMIVLSGGLATDNPILIEALQRELATETNAWAQRGLRVVASELGYFGGVYGAAAVAAQKV